MAAKFHHAGISQGTVIPCSIFTEEQRLSVAETFLRADKRSLKYLKAKYFLVILTQDCDLNKSSDKFPLIECVVAKPEKSANPVLTLAKSSRKLHVTHPCLGPLNLEYEYICTLDKSSFSGVLLENVGEIIPGDRTFNELIITWRTLCYSREAFPGPVNNAVAHFLHSIEGNELKQLLSQTEYINEMMAHVFPLDESAGHYYVHFSILLFEIGQDKKDALESLFLSCLKSFNSKFEHITIVNISPDASIPQELIEEEVIPELAFSPSDIQYSDFLKFRVYNLEYLSFTSDSGER